VQSNKKIKMFIIDNVNHSDYYNMKNVFAIPNLKSKTLIIPSKKTYLQFILMVDS